ncbi:probable ribosomal RNA small subunit methyltransferase B isoform X1 [Phoenix dactylifera]|uniref:Probable ribosomal RNA small subunit methyltransferase B isoform X1 n=1 Tax=Phoenix dactylifera TaxID=42345 RepID=A0A8B9AHM4_PHODC|nr:probable ribosomal RNA small subunit methyltransferase B isoform X1 [Phoenix dactylifera]
MEGALSFFSPSPFSSNRSNLCLPKKPLSQFSSSRASIPKVSPLARSSKRTRKPDVRISPKTAERSRISRPLDSEKINIQKLNAEVSPHRAVSAVRLLRIEQGGAFADLLNEKGRKAAENEMSYVERTLGFRTRDLDDRDIRLVTDVVGGSVRWRRYLDHLIMSLCNKERMFTDMEPLLLQILRIGFFEILKLGMPPYAVVDENVKLAKAALRPGAGNLVNAVLRKLVSLKVRDCMLHTAFALITVLYFYFCAFLFSPFFLFQEKDSLPLPTLEGDDRAQARALAVIHSHPVWMVRRWTKFLGQEEAVRLMNWNNSDPCFSLRVNTAKGFKRVDLVNRLEDLMVPYELSSCMDDFVRIHTGMQIVIQAGLLKDGICSVQDESAGLVVSVVGPQPGDAIIDCCAAPGGKTLFMASCLRGKGTVMAIDINRGRLRILKEACKLLNVTNVVTTTHADLRLYAEKHNVKVDKVLLDAPCSGTGVLSKRADLRWNRQLEDLEQLKHLQDELLDAASMLVKPGGILVYSTCSIDPEENEERVAAFLQRHPEFVVHPVHPYVPPDFITDKGFLFSNPVKHRMDGSFAARLVRSLDYPC